MANKFRGEIDIEIGGQMYTARMTFEALATIENTTGQGAYALWASFSDASTARLNHLAITLHACLVAANGQTCKLSLEDVGKEVMNGGAVRIMSSAMDLLQSALATEDDLKDAEKRANAESSKGKESKPSDSGNA